MIAAMKQALEALEDLGMKHFEQTGEVLYKDAFENLRTERRMRMTQYRNHVARDVLLSPKYAIHVQAMTREDLYGKGEIAEELTWRDIQIASLTHQLAEDQATIKELREALNDLCLMHEAQVFVKKPWDDAFATARTLVDKTAAADYTALNEALAAECERLAENVTVWIGRELVAHERQYLRAALREEAAAHRAKGEGA